MPSLVLSRRYPLTTRLNRAPSLRNLLASQDGLPCDSPELVVEVVTNTGNTRKLRFFYDTGADHMVIPVYVARLAGIRYRQEFPGTLSSTVGGSARCYYDFVLVRSSLSGRTHRWVCAFAESVKARLIIGRASFQDDFAAAIKGHHLVVSHPVPLSRFLKHHAARLRGRRSAEWEPI